uniref:Uncharacterized protein n=1 Tax=Trichobilharzia regenti TaxID=157069 RepID=A0AA85JCL5_TRIRE
MTSNCFSFSGSIPKCPYTFNSLLRGHSSWRNFGIFGTWDRSGHFDLFPYL